MEYLPIAGLKDFTKESIKLAYGDDCEAIKGNTVAAVQSLSGTGSCRCVGLLAAVRLLLLLFAAEQLTDRSVTEYTLCSLFV